MDSPLLRLADVHVSYGGIRALGGVSLEVQRGEIVAMIGANGAGKTTTLRAITGLVRPTHGSITFDGTEISRVTTPHVIALGIALAPEGRAIFSNLSVRENLELGAWTRRRRKGPTLAESMEHVFALFPRLRERLSQEGGTLSGGEQQMLAIGRAMMAAPRLMLLDEPSLGIAPKLVQQIFDSIRRIAAEGTTILLVEQNTRIALEVAARAYVLETGRIAMSGSSAELRDDPRVREAYLGG
ncbi:MAG: ABC transporter ATP-binding protein [Deltaproteobacteria bacterium]|nr:ABC transporter ATP-binding protein [Deltaproteobacteria bacterium]